MTDDEAAADPVSFVPDLAAWDAWRPEEVARRLSGVRAPWYVAAGWAIDLFLGGQRREHEDLEIAAPREAFPEIIAALPGCDFFVVGSGRAWPLDRAGVWFDTHHQTWVRERATGLWRLDIFREPGLGDTWICRRDTRLQLPYSRVIARTASGIPYAQPEIVLLFKAQAARPKDEEDFAAARPHLTPAQRRWLTNALDLAHPGHPWRAALNADETAS